MRKFITFQITLSVPGVVKVSSIKDALAYLISGMDTPDHKATDIQIVDVESVPERGRKVGGASVPSAN